jgi:hypothetical protein
MLGFGGTLGCRGQSPAHDKPSDGAAHSEESIGEATMEPDGTIVLMLRAEGPGGVRGDAVLRYPPTHPEYQETLRHLGGLKPGDHKPVPPWPEK